MRLFLLGPDIVEDASVGDLGIFWDFVPVNEKSVSDLYVFYTLEDAAYIIGHDLGIFLFIWAFNEVTLSLCLDCVWEDDYVHNDWL